MKTPVTGWAKTAVLEFAYCATMYQNALKTLEKKFSRPQAVVSAYLDKLSNFPPLKIHNSESVINFSATISALVGAFRSFHYRQDLSSASSNLRGACFMDTVKKNWHCQTLLEFKDWLKEKTEAHERLKMSSGKPKTEDNNLSANVIGTKNGAKFFASTNSSQTLSMGAKTENSQTSCFACKEKHLLWRFPVYHEKTAIQRTKLVGGNNLCFSCLNEQHSFRYSRKRASA